MRYELFYLVGASKEAELEAIKKAVTEIVTANGGVFEEKEVQEKRKMAYKIRRDTHGIYIAKRFELVERKNIQEIISKLNLHSGVIRFIISDASELPELRTKEERIEQEKKRSEQESARNRLREIEEKAAQQESAPKSTTPEATSTETDSAKDTKKAAAESEAIDKKLEEILNI